MRERHVEGRNPHNAASITTHVNSIDGEQTTQN